MRGRHFGYAASLVLLLVLPATSGAQAQENGIRHGMGRDEIVAAFVDQQLSGIYPSGTPWSERIGADGTSDYREGANRRAGRWWMHGDHFCFRYEVPMSGGCFRVVRLGTNCYELYAVSARGDAPLQAEGRWNGRMWRDDAAPTCEEEPTS